MPDRGGAGHPVMFGAPRAQPDFDPWPDGGGYPTGFLRFAYRAIGCTDPDAVLHLCSGSMRRGLTVDVRASTAPRVVADARACPFRDESFEWVLIDPPYTAEWAASLYDTASHFPSAAALTREAARLLVPGGRVGMLHHFVPQPSGLRIVAVHGITTGPGYQIRAFTVLQRDAPQLTLTDALDAMAWA